MTTEESIKWNRLEHLRYLHNLAENYKDGIFSRGRIVLVMTGVQLAFIMSAIKLYLDYSSVEGGSISTPTYVWIFFLLASLTSLIAVASIIRAILPLQSLTSVGRIIAKTTEYDDSSKIIPIISSFNHVVKQERDSFSEKLANADVDSLYKDLTITYYNLSHVVNVRYMLLRRAAIYQLVSLIITVVFLSIVFFEIVL